MVTMAVLTTSLSGQTDSTEYDSLPEWGNMMDHYFGLLDESEMPTDFLADRGFFYYPADNFTGMDSIIDTIVNFNQWKAIYGGIFSSAVSADKLPQHWSEWEDLAINDEGQGIIDIPIMHYIYHRLLEDSTELFTHVYLDEDGRLNQVEGDDGPLYHTFEAFAATPYKSVFYDALGFSFKLPYNLFFTNLDKQISNIQIDFSDGSGFQVVDFDEVVSISWDDFGEKLITIKVDYDDATQYIAYSKINLVNNSNNQSSGKWINGAPGYDFIPDEAHYITSGFSNNLGAILQIEFGCGNHNIVKPFIIVEGYNTVEFDGGPRGTQYFDAALNLFRYENNDFPGEFDIWDALQNEGYDIIYIDFDQGDGDLRENSYVVMEAIRWINQQKAANGSTESNIITGFSMGGILARYALLKLEETEPGTHDVRFYYSFDSPHLGANIPIGFQWMVEHLYHSCVKIFGNNICIRDFAPELIDARNVLRRDATAQLVRYYIGKNPGYSRSLRKRTSYTEPIRIDFLSFNNELRNLGMPTETEANFGIANGNAAGEDQGYNSLQKIFDAECQTSYAGCLFTTNGINNKYQFVVHATPGNTTTDFRVYKGKMYHNPLGFLPPIYIATPFEYKMANAHPYDNAPGGVYDLNNFGFDASLIPFQNVNSIIQNFCFIPTVSALNIESEINNPHYSFNPANLVTQSKTNFSEVNVYDPTIYNTGGFGLPAFDSEDHTDLTPSNMDLFELNLFRDHDELTVAANSLIDQKTYNFGTSTVSGIVFKTTNRITSTVRVRGVSSNEGRLCINCDGKIGFDDSSNPSPNGSHVAVSVTQGCNPIGGLIVEDHGVIEIGKNNTQSGELIIRENAFIHFESGSKLVVRNGSKLVIEDGAEFVLDEGVVIELDDHGSLLIVKGKFDIRDNATFTVSGNGRVVFDQNVRSGITSLGVQGLLLDEYWSIGSNTKFVLEGPGSPVNKDHFLLEAHKPVYFKTENGNTFSEVKFKNGRIALHQNALLFSFSPTTLSFVKVNGAYPWVTHGGFRLWNNPGPNLMIGAEFSEGYPGAWFHWVGGGPAIKLIACKFENNIEAMKQDGGSFELLNTDFLNNDYSVDAYNLSGNSLISSCDFTATASGPFSFNFVDGVNLRSQEGASVSISNSRFLNNQRAAQFSNINTRISCSEFTLSENNGITSSNGSLDIGDKAGNKFVNNDSWDIYVTGNYDKTTLFMDNGQNDFAIRQFNQGHYLRGNILNGLPIFLNSSNEIPADNNKMPLFSGIMPVSFRYRPAGGSYTSIYLDIPTNLSTTQNVCSSSTELPLGESGMYRAVVGQSEPGGRVSPYDGPEKDLKVAALDAIINVSFGEEERDDLTALLDLTHLLGLDITDPDNSTGIILAAVYNQMLIALNNCYQYESLTNLGFENPINPSDTLLGVIDIIDNILFSLDATDTLQQAKVFNKNLDKAHAYRVAGYYSQALSILNNSNLWTFSYTQQQRAGYWTCVCEIENDYFNGNISQEQYSSEMESCASQYSGYAYKDQPLEESQSEWGYNVGWDENILNDLFIYPQPVETELILTSSRFMDLEINISINDASGKLVYESKREWQGKELPIHISFLTKGIYALRLESGDKMKIFKVIKE